MLNEKKIAVRCVKEISNKRPMIYYFLNMFQTLNYVKPNPRLSGLTRSRLVIGDLSESDR